MQLSRFTGSFVNGGQGLSYDRITWQQFLELFIKALQDNNATGLEEVVLPLFQAVSRPFDFTDINTDPYVVFAQFEIVLLLLEQVLQGQACVGQITAGNVGVCKTLVDIWIFRRMLEQALENLDRFF